MLTIYSLGFFLYPYEVDAGGTKCPCIAVPRAPQHLLFVLVRKGKPRRKKLRQAESTDPCEAWDRIPVDESDDCIDITITGESETKATVKRQKLNNGVPKDPGKYESWNNFDLIPDVEDFTDSTKLLRDWQTRLRARLNCIGGQLTAVPDKYTLDKEWRWKSGHTQVVSSLGKYTVSNFKKGTLTVGEGKPRSLDSNDIVVLLHVVDKETESDEERYARGLDHHVAIMKLCEQEKRVTIHNPLDWEVVDKKPKAPEDYVLYVSPALECARSKQGIEQDPQGGPEEMELGYPSCSGRRMRL